MQDAAGRRGGGLMSIPWDPMSWGSVYSTHTSWLSTTQALLLPRRLLLQCVLTPLACDPVVVYLLNSLRDITRGPSTELLLHCRCTLFLERFLGFQGPEVGAVVNAAESRRLLQ